MIYYVLVLYYFFIAISSYIRSKGPVNIYQGIRNIYTMRTDAHWAFAHLYAFKVYLLMGIIVFILTILGSNFIDYEGRALAIVILQLVPLLFAKALVIKRMKAFDEAYKQNLIDEGSYKLLAALYKD